MDADTIAQGRSRFAALQAKVKETIDYYKKLQTISIPDLIIEVGDDIDIATEFLVPKLPNATLALWRKRASKIEKINEALADFEFGMVEELTISESRIWASEIYKVFGIIEWLAGHIGEITLLIAAAAGWVSGRYGDEIKTEFKNAWKAATDLNWKKVVQAGANVVFKGEQALKDVIEGAVLVMVVNVLEEALAAFSAGSFTKSLIPVMALKAATEKALMDAAFPQGKGRVRRERRHRQREKQ